MAIVLGNTIAILGISKNVSKPEMAQFGDPYFLAWTTTPWTLPSNTALCVGPNITYLAVQTYNPYTGIPMTAVIAKDLLSAYFNPKAAELSLSDYKPGAVRHFI